MGPIGCPETSVRNCHYSLRNSAEECSSHLLRSGSLKSRFTKEVWAHLFKTTWLRWQTNERVWRTSGTVKTGENLRTWKNLPHCVLSATDCSEIEHRLQQWEVDYSTGAYDICRLINYKLRNQMRYYCGFPNAEAMTLLSCRDSTQVRLSSVPADIWCCNASLQARVVQHLQHRVLRYLVRQRNAVWGC